MHRCWYRLSVYKLQRYSLKVVTIAAMPHKLIQAWLDLHPVLPHPQFWATHLAKTWKFGSANTEQIQSLI